MSSSNGHGGRILSTARSLGLRPEDLTDFSASINPLGPSCNIAGAVLSSLADIRHYPEAGSPLLAGRLAYYHGLPEGMIAVANGSTELIYLLPRVVSKTPGRSLIIAPAFSEYARGLEVNGWAYELRCLDPESSFDLDLAAVRSALERGYDLLFICNPGNPTGRLYQKDEIALLYGLCRQAGCFMVLDEAFMDFTEQDSAKQILPSDGDWMILRSMTKFFGFPGIRLGYSIAPERVTEAMERLLPPWNVGTLAQAAALTALDDMEHAAATVEFVRTERGFLLDGLGRIPALKTFPAAANYLLLQIKNGMTAAALQERLLAERLLIRDCGNFPGLDESFFRIAIRSRVENLQLVRMLEQVFPQV